MERVARAIHARAGCRLAIALAFSARVVAAGGSEAAHSDLVNICADYLDLDPPEKQQ
jgi:hypothetical protein